MLAIASAALAQGEPILHEFIANVREGEVDLRSNEIRAPGEETPSALVYQGEILDRPSADQGRRGDERASRAPQGSAGPTFRPDRTTSLDGTLDYQGSFSPSIAPYKRVSALDEVAMGAVPVLGVRDRTLQTVPIEGADSIPPDERPRDRFWGNIVLDFSGGTRVPLPSVSPESRILSWEVQEDLPVEVFKDRADNYYAVAPESLRREVRVVFLTDAPHSYFNAPQIPSVPSDALGADVPPLPQSILADALEFASELGIERGDPLPEVLGVLTTHFRSFRESDGQLRAQENIYLDLARSQKGVCRHRAYAFVITARALGIPARFVMNEAHAWTELRMPEVGWMRLDLGGAAGGLDVHGDDAPTYHPRHPDPLPRPAAYTESLRQANGGGNASAATVANLLLEDEAESGHIDDGGNVAAGATGAAAETSESGEVDESAEPLEMDALGNSAPPVDDLGTGEPRAEEEEVDDAAGLLDQLLAPANASMPELARPTRTFLDESTEGIFRGEAMELSGRVVTSDDEGAEGLRVEILLRSPRLEHLLGVTVTDAQGRFRGTFGVPTTWPLGNAQLLVRTPGDARHLPSSAR